MMRHYLTLLRHGESAGNADQILQGQIDSDLTDSGREQARQVALRWKENGVVFDQITSSPLRRAQETAKIVAEGIGYQGTFEIDPAWQERGFGDLEGKTFESLNQDGSRIDYFDPYAQLGRTGESMTDLFLRASQAIQKLVRRPAQRYLVASHGAMIGKALYAVMGITPQGHYNSPSFNLGNTAYINLAFNSENRQWTIYGINNPLEWTGMVEIPR